MRMWMVNPKFMCTMHLLGEHVEIHMFCGTIKKGIRLDGYIKNDLLEPKKLLLRHDVLVEEMFERGMKHSSDFVHDIEFFLEKIPQEFHTHEIDVKNARKILFSRCQKCEARYEKSLNVQTVPTKDLLNPYGIFKEKENQ